MRYKVVESREWYNTETGQTASIHGAHPHAGIGDDNWVVRSKGWTIADTESGTVGFGRPPMQSRDEAETLAMVWELDRERRRGAHAFSVNPDAKFARAIEPSHPACVTAFWDGWNTEFEASRA